MGVRAMCQRSVFAIFVEGLNEEVEQQLGASFRNGRHRVFDNPAHHKDYDDLTTI